MLVIREDAVSVRSVTDQKEGSERQNRRPAVLVIDDDPQSLELAVATLEQEGREILCTSNPEEGLAIALSQHPAVVICDVIMPGVSGFEVLDRIVHSGSRTHVLLSTSYYTQTLEKEALRRGATACLPKPLSTRLLRSLVSVLLQRDQE